MKDSLALRGEVDGIFASAGSAMTWNLTRGEIH